MFPCNAIEDTRAEPLGRRRLLALALAGAAAGCSPQQSPFWGTVFGGIGRTPSPPVSIERARALPYASMLLWFEGTAKALLVLGGRDAQDNFQWFSAGRQSVTTFGPFVTQVFGTEVELLRTNFGGPWTAHPGALVGRDVSRTIELRAETGRNSSLLRSRFRDEGPDEVELLGERRRLLRVSEQVRVPDRARFENLYWLDEAGRCLKSRQLAVPMMPVVNIEFVKLPRVA